MKTFNYGQDMTFNNIQWHSRVDYWWAKCFRFRSCCLQNAPFQFGMVWSYLKSSSEDPTVLEMFQAWNGPYFELRTSISLWNRTVSSWKYVQNVSTALETSGKAGTTCSEVGTTILSLKLDISSLHSMEFPPFSPLPFPMQSSHHHHLHLSHLSSCSLENVLLYSGFI